MPGLVSPTSPSTNPPGTTALWQLRLLGAFELSDGQRRHTRLSTRAAMVLLALLCLRPGTAQPRETLVELLWPDVEPAAGRQRLRQTLSTLRQVLEPTAQPLWRVIDADRLAIRLVPGTIHCDAVAFEAAFRQQAHALARTLYTGELLPGIYDEWISDERLRLEGLFDRLPLTPAPFAPAPNTPLLTQQVSQSTATRSAHQPRLPAYLTRMIGAEVQLIALRQTVCSHRLVTLMGPGGNGKTRLAVEVAKWLSVPEADDAERPFDLLTFVPLAACTNSAQVLDQILLSLQLTSGQAGALAALVQGLQGRPALLVLDNFEQAVDEASELIAELIAQLPQLHLLLTSRRALALPGEREVQTASLPLPNRGARLEEAAANPAVTLFVDRAQASRAEFHLHAANCAAVVELMHALEGMPLAIELAAARIRSVTPQDMLNTLERARTRPAGATPGQLGSLDLLARPAISGRQDTRHHSMRDTIDWSWQLLTPALQSLLARLTVFHGSFTAAAAQAVCDADSQYQSADPLLTPVPVLVPVLMQLDDLVSHSLLRSGTLSLSSSQQAPPTTSQANTSEPLRFSLYEPIREFAAATVAPDLGRALRARHRSWAMTWGDSLAATPSLAALRAEWPNLVAAMGSAVADGEPAAAIRTALALRPALEDSLLPDAAKAALQQACQACDDVALRVDGQVLLGFDLFRSGRSSDSRQLFEQACALAPPSRPDIQARALLGLATLDFNAVATGTAPLALLDQARNLAEQAGDALLVAHINRLSGDVLGHRGRDFAGALALQERALATWQAHGNRLAVLRCSYQMAQLALGARQYQSVLRQITPVIDEARQMQAWHTVAQCLNLRGLAHERTRHWPEACADLAAALHTAWLSLDTWDMARAMGSLMRPLARNGQPLQAVQLAGFISTFWVQRFSPLHRQQVLGLRRVRRLAAVQMGQTASDAGYAAGQQMALTSAIQLGLPKRQTSHPGSG